MCLEEPMCKPAVPRCGHAGCFWCVHRSMDHFGASACPTCRQPFEHLPDVCVPLHRFLARAFPAEYARRLRETHEEEETKECFSPSPALDLDLGELTDKKEEEEDANASPLAFFDALERAPAVRGADDPKLERLFLCGFQDDHDHNHEKKRQTQTRRHALREPVVLTCGHAVCASCARSRLDFREDRFFDDSEAPSEDLMRTLMRTRCPVCDARVVGNAPPTVCLPLHELTRAFASDNDDDAAAETIEKSDSGNANPERARAPFASSRSPPIEASVERRPANGTLAERFLQVTGNMSPEAFVHHAVGCDGCGAYPIRGRRFTCADCSSTAMGFDLCARCHESLRADERDETRNKNKNKNVRGRFNQNHTKEHAMHEVAPVPTVMHFLTSMHPDLTPAQILDLAARRHSAEPEDGDARGTEEAPTEER